MGLALEFILGDTEAIVRALEAEDFDWMDDDAVVEARADFSLHLVPRDLDLLSHAIGRHTGQPLRDLGSSLVGLVDTESFGALAVAPEWIAYVAALSSEHVPAVVETWFASMRAAQDEPGLQATPDAEQAVRDLLSVCKLSQTRNSEILHVWYL